MKVLISGGRGFIGTELSRLLLEKGDSVWVLTRNPNKGKFLPGVSVIQWDGMTLHGWAGLVPEMDAIVNLAGENIGSGRWTQKRKAKFLSSRVRVGNTIVEAIRHAQKKPDVLIQASAVGYYGPHGEELVTEETSIGQGFLAEVCKAWEASSLPVEAMGIRRVVIRTGIVLSTREGALARLILPFKAFIGGPVGKGRQGFPWIHPWDEIAAIRFLIENKHARGAFNLSAPKPLSNADFSNTLARVLNRPCWLPLPALFYKVLLGEMATLLVDGQFMIPSRLLALGYQFKYDSAENALEDLIRNK